jgi:hypothetical protein
MQKFDWFCNADLLNPKRFTIFAGIYKTHQRENEKTTGKYPAWIYNPVFMRLDAFSRSGFCRGKLLFPGISEG